LSSRQSYALAVVVLLVAISLRAFGILDVPNGIASEEVTTIRLTETVRQGNVTVFLQDERGQGRESAYPTALAVVTATVGNGLLGYRALSLWVGVVTLALVYTLGARLFGHVAGLLAMALLSVTFWAVLLSRLLVVETLTPLLVVLTMLALARAFLGRRSDRTETATTLAFAMVGAVVGGAFYVSTVGVWLAAGAMAFLSYVLLIRRGLSRQTLSYIGFALLVTIIISVPYLLFNLNRPELSASNRLFGAYQGIFNSILQSVVGLFLQGDLNPVTNIPSRPLFEPLTFALVCTGVGTAISKMRQGRHALLLLFLICLAPSVFLAGTAPSFLGMSAWLVPLALAYGVGVTRLYAWLPMGAPRLAFGCAVGGLLLLNAYGTAHDTFSTWVNLPSVQEAYHSDLHRVARYLDRTQGTQDTIICNALWDITPTELTNTQRLQLSMTRRLPVPRVADCRVSLIFTNGGEAQQYIFPDANDYDDAHPNIKRWLTRGTWVLDGVPRGRVLRLEVRDELADALGLLTTTAPASYSIEAPRSREQVYPPVRFGGNVTWLGYAPAPVTAKAGDTLEVVTYWRIDGVIPRDLRLFTHLLADPATLADNRDVIHVNPRRLQERDIFLQVTSIALQPTLLPGVYEVSIGAYQAETLARLPVFDEGQTRQSDRLILYPVTITAGE
jgi:4-amino-4-deoxy-L-arabinose transferase-like glycosyltransferase